VARTIRRATVATRTCFGARNLDDERLDLPPGAFMFSDADPKNLEGKERSALHSGFLGVSSLGWSLAQIVGGGARGNVAAVDASARGQCDRLRRLEVVA